MNQKHLNAAKERVAKETDWSEAAVTCKDLIDRLTADCKEASEKYYYGEPIMSDKLYDEHFDLLKKLEDLTGYRHSDSPTVNVGSDVDSHSILGKVKHEYPALSLAKTKDVDALVAKMAEAEDAAKHLQSTILMWKCDGMTVQATYDNGKLIMAATRGNGEVGEDIIHNAPYINGLPGVIPYKGHLVVRGEAMISFREYERINSELPADTEPYKNPRNLVSGTIRLDASPENAKMRNREVTFFAFQMVYKEADDNWAVHNQFDQLKDWGFNIVPFARTSAQTGHLKAEIEKWSDSAYIKSFGYPVDGLVVRSDNSHFTDSLPGTGHNPHPYGGYALKWADTTAETVLRDIEWSPSRTGLLNPVAVFDPVELEGTTVSRASLHNVSYIIAKDLRIGDTVTVYKANMIIPQIDENLSSTEERRKVQIIGKNGHYKLIETCPCCGNVVSMIQPEKGSDTRSLYCNNPACPAKQIGTITHFCERDCMNIVGLSEEKIAFLAQKGYIRNMLDLMRLPDHGNHSGVTNLTGDRLLENEDGWGVKAVDNLVNSITKAKTTDFVSFMHAMSIPGFGKGQSKLLLKHLQLLTSSPEWGMEQQIADWDGSYDLMGYLAALVYQGYDFSQIDGFGPTIVTELTRWVTVWLVDPITQYWDESLPECMIINLLKLLTFTDVKPETDTKPAMLSGKVFVITGSLHHYANRDALVSAIEQAGGKVSGSVSAKTSFLVNNDATSASEKNRKAKALNIPVISEDELRVMLATN